MEPTERPHSREPRDSGSPDEAKQDGLGLIIGGVGDRDAGAPGRDRHAAQRGVAKLPRRFLQRLAPLALSRHGIDPRRHESDSQAPRHLLDERRVLFRFLTAEAVVHVPCDEVPLGNAVTRPVPDQEIQEGHGIGTARDAHDKGSFAGDQLVRGDQPLRVELQPLVARVGAGSLRASRCPGGARSHPESIDAGRGCAPRDRKKLVAAQGFEPRTKGL